MTTGKKDGVSRRDVIGAAVAGSAGLASGVTLTQGSSLVPQAAAQTASAPAKKGGNSYEVKPGDLDDLTAMFDWAIAHPDARVRQHAWLALVGLPEDWTELAAAAPVLEADAEPLSVLEAALLAVSRHPHPSTRLLLYELARSPARPLAAAAIRRLGELRDLLAEDLVGVSDASGEVGRVRGEALGVLVAGAVAAYRQGTIRIDRFPPHRGLFAGWSGPA